jgi:genome maintenance exonuclease 1
VITNKFEYKPMTRGMKDGKRAYLTPEGESLVSVTTILEATKPAEARQKLQEWRDRVGHEQAQKITTEAASRGTRMHTYLERYVKNDDLGEFPANPFAQPSWFMAAQVILEGLQHVDEYWGCEVPLYYSGLYAGTTDCVGVWKGQPAIMDFKQTNRPKKREWIDDYFLQLAAYAAAHNSTHGTNINTGVILMCARPADEHATPQYQEFVLEPKDFAYWSDQWMRRVELYYLSS